MLFPQNITKTPVLMVWWRGHASSELFSCAVLAVRLPSRVTSRLLKQTADKASTLSPSAPRFEIYEDLSEKKVSVIMVFSEHKHLLKADEHGLAIIFRNDRSWGPFGAARLGAALRSLISAWRRHPGRAGSWEFQAVNVRAEFDTLCARPSRLGRRTQIRAPQEIVAEWVNPPVILAPKMVHVKCFKTLEDVNYVYTWCPLVMTSD